MSLHRTKEIKQKKYIKSPYFKYCQLNTMKGRSIIYQPQRLCVDRGMRLTLPFFDIPCEDLAKALLGKILIRAMKNGTVIKGLIVETESYLGGEDKASFSYRGKITERNKPMYMQPGTTFVYTTYGTYDLLNISSQGKCHP